MKLQLDVWSMLVTKSGLPDFSWHNVPKRGETVLRYFPECQVSEHQISERHIAEIHLFELPNFRTDKCSKSQIFELIFVRITNFRAYKIFEQKLVVPGVILSSLDLTNLT
jgi:hypothetical protein